MFCPGQLVVCVDDAGQPKYTGTHTVARGVVYTVRQPVVYSGRDGLLLEEIVNPLHPDGMEFAFHARRFSPIHDDKINVFRAALEPTPKEPVLA